jgi:hypothetical protein
MIASDQQPWNGRGKVGPLPYSPREYLARGLTYGLKGTRYPPAKDLLHGQASAAD